MRELMLLFTTSTSRAVRTSLFNSYRKLHNERSPEFIAWMERERRIDK